ncbi:MAG TPA: cation-translocating P-type ATPase, partial [Burkholderiales bacterium]|nr:cation-translocating P-type ATPase [Burkholderiales bacterium]
IREPMFLLLVAASTIYLVFGDVREAIVLLASILVVMGITIYQSRKTESALEALRDLSSPRALVLRDGVLKRIAGREVVRGDIMMLKEGDRVPADARLFSANDLRADESLLTGESVPVDKTAAEGEMPAARPGGDGLPFVYAGTMLVQGQGSAEVVAIGAQTEFGRIGKALQSIDSTPTRLQRETGVVVRRLAAGGLLLCALVVLIYGLTRGDWLAGFLAGVTLAMAILPEEFPVVLTVFLALGAWRISRHGVLTRHMPASETLGSATVLCVDKTGTLTLNQMTVKRLAAGDEQYDVELEADSAASERLREVVDFGMLASEARPVDPMEKAIVALGERLNPGKNAGRQHWLLVKEYPLTSALLAHAHGWNTGVTGDPCVVAIKGAPETVADLCRLNGADRVALQAQITRMAADGLRVLGVARAVFRGDSWPASPKQFEFEWLGLIGLADPVRPTVAAAVRECQGAGIRVVMITGDYPVTARAIGRQVGLENDVTITGPELQAMDDAELRSRIRTASVFARVIPEQKLRLIEAFKANGDIVAMTGDGVNDAPALKAADIGIAMGGRGTDVAREASSLVLLNDDFDSIVQAVRLGRRIYRNISNAMSYLIAVHIPTAGMAFLPLLFGWPMAFFPVHIVFFEFVIDPACSIAFEAEPSEDSAMRRPPRAVDAQLFDYSTVFLNVLQGAGVLAAVAAVYGYSLAHGSEHEARAMAFVTIIFGNAALILVNRSRENPLVKTFSNRNPALWSVIAGALAAMGLVLYVPYLRELFQVAALGPAQVVTALFAAAIGVAWFECYKVFRAQAGSPAPRT